MNWFSKLLPPKIKGGDALNKKGVPEGVWVKCGKCTSVLYQIELGHNLNVCPKCGYHMRIGATERIQSFLDENSMTLLKGEVKPVDKLKFKDQKKYRERLADAQKKTGQFDALVAAEGKLYEMPVVVAAFEFAFMGGSMGSVVGERFVNAVDACIEANAPFVCFSASGGARMQEAMYSLMQMAKTTAAINRLNAHQLPYVSVLTDPTMGGVSASLGMLGDIIIAEPEAVVGFAGRRVVEQTVREELPDNFQKAEFLLEHGAIDMIVDRRKIRDTVSRILKILLDNHAGAVQYAE